MDPFRGANSVYDHPRLANVHSSLRSALVRPRLEADDALARLQLLVRKLADVLRGFLGPIVGWTHSLRLSLRTREKTTNEYLQRTNVSLDEQELLFAEETLVRVFLLQVSKYQFCLHLFPKFSASAQQINLGRTKLT